ncbi:bifunctional adenosylcobinamide kinase/adenosylcobinamide-phosphate guanylyltransferase [Paenibacillus sp. JNUCC31]|uniref:bifunctional adenosylcobinamide kinase/adenosylcobinamide-phosphate guanylyltransferase n=1 Tax=Paenibacillus sp. JNUCC-31 TaxID=2777983 RepID=UPI00177A8C91|nr:bifunctional adenosylcobinamide kinase/adenosylcobinamide-phosphate guanylyltransferase [Paenibacillus sp. JNUCC-31]QOS77831.1 bifunctional adenosylcobinamide kinase/adenosylcobinamide-phosphate guanylyltransferase [Paenibacillus sp. JNUCC-31]
MLITVTGGIGSGKTRFALGYAARISREGIYLSTGDHDPVIPELPSAHYRAIQAGNGQHLTEVLHQINRESNLFLADKRIVIVDSLTAWMAAGFRASDDLDHQRLETQLLLDALLSYQGKLLVITNEMHGSLYPSEEERIFAARMASVNRALQKHSEQMYILVSGLAVDLKAQKMRYEDW